MVGWLAVAIALAADVMSKQAQTSTESYAKTGRVLGYNRAGKYAPATYFANFVGCLADFEIGLPYSFEKIGLAI